MILIVCLDDKNGISFNNRRQSKDRRVRERMLDISAKGTLFVNEYSLRQFEEENSIISDNDFLQNAKEGDFCFAESGKLAQFEEKIEKIIVFRWNRVYPSDIIFDIDLSNWHLKESRSFEGSSHAVITEEVYER